MLKRRPGHFGVMEAKEKETVSSSRSSVMFHQCWGTERIKGEKPLLGLAPKKPQNNNNNSNKNSKTLIFPKTILAPWWGERSLSEVDLGMNGRWKKWWPAIYSRCFSRKLESWIMNLKWKYQTVGWGHRSQYLIWEMGVSIEFRMF